MKYQFESRYLKSYNRHMARRARWDRIGDMIDRVLTTVAVMGMAALFIALFINLLGMAKR